jgi:hypothetical protein
VLTQQLYATYRVRFKPERRGMMATKRTMLGQLTSVGEGAIERLAQNPVTHKAVESAIQVKERVEKVVRGLESMEQRMSALEKRLEALEKVPKRRTTTRKTTTTAKKD